MARQMKDSGVEWLGMIPINWNVKPMKQILVERKEKNDPIRTNEILSLSIERGVFPYSEKVGGGNKAKEDLTAYKLAYPNDIVLNSMNVIVGAVGLSKYFGCVSPVYYTLYPRTNDYDIRYYSNIFQSSAFQKSLMGYGNGIMMKESDNGKLNTIRMRIPMEKLNMVILPIPISKEEQQKIADFLDEKVAEIDSVIAKTKETIEDYKKYKQAIITETVTKGLNSDVKMKDCKNEYLGRIPAHWGEKRLRFLGTCQNGISKSSEYFGEGYPFVSYGDVYKNFALLEKGAGLIRSSEDDRNTYSVRYGDVFFTRTSESIEEVGFTSTCLKTIDDATFAGFVIRFRPNNQEELIPEFSKYYFRSDAHRKFFVKEMNLVTRASLSQELLKKLPVLLPPIAEQKKIANFLDKKCSEIDKLIAKKEELLADLESYKKSLIYEYVTGKKEVQQTTIIPFPATVSCKDKRFAQAVLLTKILDEFGNYHSGRVKVAKTLYVIENHIGFDFDTDVIRQVAGPLDEKYYKAEAIIRHNNWFSVLTQGGTTRYFAQKNKNQYLTYYGRYFKDYDVEIQRIIDIFKNLDMNGAELLATAYASWNDFIIKGISFTQDDIVEDIFSWDDSKKRFSKEKWLEALNDLNKKQLSPIGHGKMTILENRS
ncbi:restriction endonuclease subunit S [Lachnospiraceae bacterium 62-26]